jgi:4-amino-4-deoxy-L-arabinose transferase-like glycosyltransferase
MTYSNEFSKPERRTIFLLICISSLVWLVGWFIPLIEIDAAQYANISREMIIHNHFLQFYDRGLDYLDKPPMLFWLSSLSMRIFGINDAAYRLPSYLFALLSVYSTFRFASVFYNQRIAWLSALVLASCQAMFLITHDVRTDTMLMGWVIFGIWQMSEWYRGGRWKNLLLASIAIAGGMMTKGPIAIMVMVFAFAPHFLLKRNFRQWFRWEYLIMLLIIAVLLIPMSIGLYEQFDLHPEKVVYGKTGTSGLRFFFWTQSFGRITGESTWSENAHFYFLFQNLLWGFLPWTIFFIGGLVDDLTGLFHKKFRLSGNEEWITTGGFVITYCALGISKYQLPHYIYVVLPLAAVMTAKWIEKLIYSDSLRKWQKPILIFHAIVFSLLGLTLFFLLDLPFPPANLLLISLFFICILLFIIMLVRKRIPISTIIALPAISILVINFFVDTGFYPKLLQYQAGVKLSEIISKQHLDKDRIYIFKINEDRTLHFYSNHFFNHVANLDSLRKDDYIITSFHFLDSLNPGQFNIVDSIQDFHVSALSLPFLNPSRRKKETTPMYILQKQ